MIKGTPYDYDVWIEYVVDRSYNDNDQRYYISISQTKGFGREIEVKFVDSLYYLLHNEFC